MFQCINYRALIFVMKFYVVIQLSELTRNYQKSFYLKFALIIMDGQLRMLNEGSVEGYFYKSFFKLILCVKPISRRK